MEKKVIEFPAELENVLSVAVSLGRARMLDKGQFEDLKVLDTAIDRYRTEKREHNKITPSTLQS